MAASLPEDVLLEILARLEEAPDLFRCATACKRWHSLVADHTFLRRRWPDQSVSFIGFIAKDKRRGRSQGVTGLVIPGPRSALGRVSHARALRSFMPAAYAGLFKGAVPLASRHGLLLLRLGSALADADRTVVHMVVCNLIAGTCDMLPPLRLRSAYDNYEWCGYAILTDVDCRPQELPPMLPRNSSFFKVLIIGSDESKVRYGLYTISSRKASWRKRINYVRIGVRTDGSFSDVTVCRGMAHWLYYGSSSWFYHIAYNIRSGHIYYGQLRMPMNYNRTGRPCLTLTVDETLSLLCMQKTGRQLEILVPLTEQQYEGGNSNWLIIAMIELKRSGEEETEERGLDILGGECGAILVKDSRQHVYTIELETGTMEEVEKWPRKCGIIPWESMPLEMDWSTFFISRLGIRDSKHPLFSPRDKTPLKSRKCRGRKGKRKSIDHANASEEAAYDDVFF